MRGDARADRSIGVDWGERKLEEPCGGCGVVDGMFYVRCELKKNIMRESATCMVAEFVTADCSHQRLALSRRVLRNRPRRWAAHGLPAAPELRVG